MVNNIKKRSLKFKLTLSYLFIALMLVGSVSLFSNVLFQKQFEAYIMRKQNIKNEEAVTLISQLYSETLESYDMEAMDTVGMNALEDGLILKVTDASGVVVWDAMVHNLGLCVQMLQSMADSMQSRHKNFEGTYEESIYKLSNGIGTVSVGYYGPFYYSENDSLFLDTLNKVLMIVGLLSLAFAILLGFYIARRISTPLHKTVNATMKIAQGDYSVGLATRAAHLKSLI